MSAVELGVMFTLGLASSLHCLQMCGPIVLSYSLGAGNSGGSGKTLHLALGHLAYNFGRIITYSMLGALAGLAGRTLGLLGQVAGVSKVAVMVGGGLMIIAGLFMLDIVPSRALAGIQVFRLTSGFMRRVGGCSPPPRRGSVFSSGWRSDFFPVG